MKRKVKMLNMHRFRKPYSRLAMQGRIARSQGRNNTNLNFLIQSQKRNEFVWNSTTSTKKTDLQWSFDRIWNKMRQEQFKKRNSDDYFDYSKWNGS